MAGLDLVLNPDLDPAALAKTYAEQGGQVRIQNLWSVETAEAILETLATKTPWKLVHSDAQGAHKYYTQAEFSSLPKAEQDQIFGDVHFRARDGFAYLYTCFPMISAYISGEEPNWPLHAMTEFLNTPDFHNFVKQVTGDERITKIDAQATNYAPGHFLNLHNDTGTNAERAVAYVMGFTKGWPTDWGGQLLFTNESGGVANGYSPSFNSLTLFKVPRPHIVTQVSTFAGARRFSITGWLRTD